MAFSFLSILVLSTFPGWHTETEENGSESSIADREIKPFPSKLASHLGAALTVFGSIFLFVSMLWQHVSSAAAASMVGSLTYGTVEGRVGPAAMALGWTAVFCQFVVFAGIMVMILSIKVLAEVFG